MTGKILWTDKQPTAEEIEAARRAEVEDAGLARDVALQAALSVEADPLFFKWQRGECEKDDWLAVVAEVKARYPKMAV